MFCKNCGAKIEKGAMFCPACGNEIRINDTNQEPDDTNNGSSSTNAGELSGFEDNTAQATVAYGSYNGNCHKIKMLCKKHWKYLCGGFAIIIVLCFVITNMVSISRYKKLLDETYSLICKNANLAEEYSSLEEKVWRNSIMEEKSYETDKYTHDEDGDWYDDFNDALLSFGTGEYLKSLAVSSNNKNIKENISKLKNPPSKYKDEYKSIKKLYTAYAGLADLVLGNSSYSLNSFSDALYNAKAEYKSAQSEASTLFE